MYRPDRYCCLNILQECLCGNQESYKKIYYFGPCSHFELMAICIGANIDPQISFGSFKFILFR